MFPVLFRSNGKSWVGEVVIEYKVVFVDDVLGTDEKKVKPHQRHEPTGIKLRLCLSQLLIL